MRLAALVALAALAHAEQKVVTILATTDLHGNLLPIDYVTGKPAPRGLARVATLIRSAEAENPDHLLIDCGDTIQGTPLEYVYQTYFRTGSGPFGLKPAAPLTADPMMLAMNALGYDAMALGNHEFNFGLRNLTAARDAAKFPWLSANTTGGDRPFAPYIVKTVGNVKVAVIGITTPVIPMWEKPENLGTYRFRSPIDAVRETIATLRAHEHPDLIVVAAHSGLGPEEPAENVVAELAAKVEGIDAILFGHSHRELEGREIGGTLVVQPKNWGISLARVDITVERQAGGPWTRRDRRSRLIPVKADTPAAPDIVEIARPYHELAERYLNTPVATSAVAQTAALARVMDTPLVDAVQQVQLSYAHADVSFTAAFNPAVRVPKGQVTVRQIAALYPYDNELYAIEGTGKMVRDALENAARFYLSCEGARCGREPLINREVAGFNYDMAEGVEYEIDLTGPAGDRIRNLRFQGEPLAPDRKLRIAINNYRAAGSAGYSMFAGAPVVWRSGQEIRDLMVDYYTARKALPVAPSGNWRVVPELAAKTLAREALTAAGHQGNQ
jgi:2',3'-cyclic-nucleotide 2'-phosphodiesterase / 3'-nucleotidase